MIDKKVPASNPLKEKVARHIRMADIFAKEGRYEEAKFEIDQALALEPKNYYARSFEERLKQQIQKSQQQASMLSQSLMEKSEQEADMISALLRNADQYIEQKQYKLALEEIAKVYQIDPQNYYALAHSDRIEMLMHQESLSQADVPPPEHPTAQVPAFDSDATKDEKPSLKLYRKMLREMLFDGKLKPDELQELAKVRDKFGISVQEHDELEKQVKIDAYVEALRIAWRDGVITKNESEVLQIMRRKYEISLEEHMSAEAKILWARSTPHAKGTILIVDDEKTILLSLSLQLKNHGYDVMTAETPEKAMAILEKNPIALVLSDLMFGEGEMSGIEFYNAVRANPGFSNIPFLLMSGISDEFVVRAGIRMGVDSFLKKPFSLDLLLATIEGQLAS